MPNTIAYLLSCSRIIKDQGTGMATYVDVFDMVLIPNGTNTVPRLFSVAGKIFDVGGNFEAEIRVLDPQGTIFATSTLPTTLLKPGDVELFASFPILNFEKLGRYQIKIKVNGLDLDDGGRYFFEVKKLPATV